MVKWGTGVDSFSDSTPEIMPMMDETRTFGQGKALEEAAEIAVSYAETPLETAILTNGNDFLQAVQAANQVVYVWDIASDQLLWSENASRVLGIPDVSQVGTGRRFAGLLDPDNMTSRYETVMNSSLVDEGEGVPLQLQYRIFPAGRETECALWVEDTGRWYVGPDGGPARVLGVLSNIQERYEHEQQLNYLSRYDQLTGLMNRERLAEGLGDVIANAEQHRLSCAFMLAAVDNLAMVNDAYGFDVADQVIAVVSQRLRGALRAGDTIGRYAGNKLGIILSNCTEGEMQVAAQRLLRSVRDAVVETDAGPVSATISIGGLVLPKHAESSDGAMLRAEESLDLAKAKHRDTFVAYKTSHSRESIRKRNISVADEIVSALNGRRLAIAYQPIIDAKSGTAALYECLLRLVKPDGEVVSAGHFIPVAEQLGLVRLIDHRVLELAVEAIEDSPEANLSINISGMTATDPRWFANLTAYISAHRKAAERLTVEITETVALRDLEEISKFISNMRDMGCQVAIDDFGAGYTSFHNLKTLAVDMVKLDGSFCVRLSENKDNQFFVRTLIDLARNFNLRTVAEWVEDEKDAALLIDMGVDYLQGFHYGAAALEKPWLDGTDPQRTNFATL